MLSLLLILGLGLADFETGYEVSFALFYVVPVSIAGWYAGATMGTVASLASAATWHMANSYAGEQHSNALIPYWNAATRFGFFIVVTTLLGRLRRHIADQETLARVDPLTGLLNRRAIEERAALEVGRARRTGAALALVYLDLDNFKAVNDQRGHAEGDLLLKEAARIFAASVRGIDAVGRLGGDEFCVLLLDVKAEGVPIVVNRIRQSLNAEMSRRSWPVTCSMGVVVYKTDPPDVDVLIQEADRAMYVGKRDGKDRVHLAVHDHR